jgi:aldehyde:ferredoxin oxidoreductase
MGADHTAGYAITANVLGVGGRVDPLKPEGQVALSRNLQIATAAVDASGLCVFVAFAVLDDPMAFEGVCEMFAAMCGRPFGADEFTALGKKVLAAERRFNAAAGFSPADDRLPGFFKTEKLAPHQITFAVPDEELDTVFDFV